MVAQRLVDIIREKGFQYGLEFHEKKLEMMRATVLQTPKIWVSTNPSRHPTVMSDDSKEINDLDAPM